MPIQAKVDYGQGVTDAFSRIASFVPKLLLFLVILVVGVFVAKALQKVLTKILQRVGFDQLVERGGVKQALSKSKYDAATILARIVYYLVFLLVLAAAFGVFGDANPVSQFLAKIIAFLPNLFVAVLVLVIAAAAAAAVKDILSNSLGGLSYGAMLANAASLLVLALGVFFALDQLQIAPLIVGGIFYALLALLVLPPIIAFGVGGIDPARQAIANMQGKAQQKAQEVRSQTQAQSGSGSGSGADAGSERGRSNTGEDEVPLTRRPRPRPSPGPRSRPAL